MREIILIAEDTDDVRAYMKLFLKLSGYKVYEAANGQEAIEIAKQYHPHLILMDIGMPVMDGLTAAYIIRNSTAPLSQVPIIALTAFDNSYQEITRKAGFDHFITKPVNLDKLEVIIKKYIAHYH